MRRRTRFSLGAEPDSVGAVRSTGRIDATFNAIGLPPSERGYPALSTEQRLDDFFKPLHVILGSTFLTSRTVGAQMVCQGSGSIVTLTATLSVWTPACIAGIAATCAVIEGLTRLLAGEFGSAGVRVNCVRGRAMPTAHAPVGYMYVQGQYVPVNS